MVLRIAFLLGLLLTASPLYSQDRANPFPIAAPQRIYSGAVYSGDPRGPTDVRTESTGGRTTPAEEDPPTHKPLILVKVRVVEVGRSNGLAVSSVLEYVSTANSIPSLTSGLPLNSDGTNGFENVRGLTRFGVPGLINGPTGTGAGMLVNLTSEHINWVASLLATELNGDLITAPQVTTLDGSTVTFSAGAEIPFEIGFNTIQQNTNTVQQFSYVPVGTYISVTPRIVSDGAEAEFSPLTKVSVLNWTELFWQLANNPELEFLRTDADEEFRQAVLVRLMHLDVDSVVVHEVAENEQLQELAVGVLNGLLNTKLQDGRTINRSLLRELLGGAAVESAESRCGWESENCVIDLDINVALSDGAFDPNTQTSIKDNVRNILNRVQVKSGHGVVMGGLISAEDTEAVTKTPILGDIPVVGALFRSKTTKRNRTETLVFVEAEVLPDVSVAARDRTAHDFALGQGNLTYELNCAALIRGMNSAGLMGEYLPVPSDHEKDYWCCYHKTRSKEKKRRMTTELRDALK